MDFFPIFARLPGEPCLVVGGGRVALAKSRALVAAGARLTVNAPDICAELAALANEADVTLHEAPFDAALVGSHLLVVAATGDRAVNAEVAAAARAAGRLVNVVDDPELCTYITPAVLDRAPLTVAFGTGGAAPVLARRLRQRLEAMIPPGYGELAAFAGRWRERVRAGIADPDARRRFWERHLDGATAELVLAGQAPRADALLQAALETPDGDLPGEVALVGAGPGDPELLTLAGLRALEAAEVVFHDRLVAPAILDYARRDAERVNVGKQPGGRGWSQQAINDALVAAARAGRRAVRLKGGDGGIFGRAGEEMDALATAGLPFRLVPGVTAASGCAAYAGIPLTQRGLATGVTLVTAHHAAGEGAPDWTALARLDHTLVFYMGVAALPDIARELVAAGRDPATPAALVENGTTPRQRCLRGTLADLPARAREAGAAAPALLIVGDVAGLGDRLAWFRPGAVADAA